MITLERIDGEETNPTFSNLAQLVVLRSFFFGVENHTIVHPLARSRHGETCPKKVSSPIKEVTAEVSTSLNYRFRHLQWNIDGTLGSILRSFSLPLLLISAVRFLHMC
jgi:hypothetical protein